MKNENEQENENERNGRDRIAGLQDCKLQIFSRIVFCFVFEDGELVFELFHFAAVLDAEDPVVEFGAAPDEEEDKIVEDDGGYVEKEEGQHDAEHDEGGVAF